MLPELFKTKAVYDKIAKKATEVMDFITGLSGGRRSLCMAYIAEVHELGNALLGLVTSLEPPRSSGSDVVLFIYGNEI